MITCELITLFVNRFALKCLDKKRLKLKKGEDVAINERNILLRVSSPFIVNMYYCFQSPTKLFFILDLMNGTASCDVIVTSCDVIVTSCDVIITSCDFIVTYSIYRW